MWGPDSLDHPFVGKVARVNKGEKKNPKVVKPLSSAFGEEQPAELFTRCKAQPCVGTAVLVIAKLP